MSSPLPAKAFAALKDLRSARVAEIIATPPPRRELSALDLSRWPIVVATLEPGNLLEILDAVTACHLRGPFALITDLRKAPPLRSGQRHTIAAARLADEERFPGVRAAGATVIASPPQERSVLALGWLSDVGYPREAFTRIDFAMAWCAVQLKVPA